MKNLLKIIFSIVCLLFVAVAISGATDMPLLPVLGGLTLVSFAASLSPVPSGILKGVLVELWTGELIKKFRFVGKWLSMIPSEDKYVNNNAIHLVDVGADPAVLIDNASYPIGVSARADGDIVVSLRKFDTVNTKVTRDELYGLPYDKGASVIEQHKDVLEETTSQYGLFSLAPAVNSTNTPIIVTTGANNGASRMRMTIADITNAKTRLDNLKVPLEGRLLVLCNDHVNDLLQSDQSFRDRFYNTQTGQILNFMGFNIFQDVYNPIYDASGNKRAWGAAAAPSTDRNSSVFFYSKRAFKAMGSLDMFYRDASIDPENRQTVIGFQLYHVVLPKKNIGFGAIVSTII
jgi:hypothetical protein